MVTHLPGLRPALDPLLEHAKDNTRLQEILLRVLGWTRDLDANAQARLQGVRGGGRDLEKARKLEEEVYRLRRQNEHITDEIRALSRRLWTALEKLRSSRGDSPRGHHRPRNGGGHDHEIFRNVRPRRHGDYDWKCHDDQRAWY